MEEFDTGAVLAQAGCDVPEVIDPETIRAAWGATMMDVLREGVPKALADDPGEPQPPATAKVSAPFREEELVLDWALPARRIEAQITALMMGGRQPQARFGDEIQPILAMRVLPGLHAEHPGVVNVSSRRAVVGVADAVVEVEIGRLPF